MMKKHRMGRVEEPWTNLDPPIRSPDYYKNLAIQKQYVPSAEARRSKRSVDLSSVRFPHHHIHALRLVLPRTKLTLDSRLLPFLTKS